MKTCYNKMCVLYNDAFHYNCGSAISNDDCELLVVDRSKMCELCRKVMNDNIDN